MEQRRSVLKNWRRSSFGFLFEILGARVLTTGREFSLPAEELAAPRLRSRLEEVGLRPRSVVGMRQVHGARIEEIGPGPDRVIPDCDGLITAQPGVALVARTADCLPIAAVSEDRVGVAHAGWRGVWAGIPARLVERMDGADLEVAMGPGIGPCCYEVGPEFDAWFPEHLVRREGRRFLDLAGAARGQMEAVGVAPGRIHVAPWCTACSRELLHSFRRDGAAAGRMLTVAMWVPSAA